MPSYHNSSHVNPRVAHGHLPSSPSFWGRAGAMWGSWLRDPPLGDSSAGSGQTKARLWRGSAINPLPEGGFGSIPAGFQQEHPRPFAPRQGGPGWTICSIKQQAGAVGAGTPFLQQPSKGIKNVPELIYCARVRVLKNAFISFWY